MKIAVLYKGKNSDVFFESSDGTKTMVRKELDVFTREIIPQIEESSFDFRRKTSF